MKKLVSEDGRRRNRKSPGGNCGHDRSKARRVLDGQPARKRKRLGSVRRDFSHLLLVHFKALGFRKSATQKAHYEKRYRADHVKRPPVEGQYVDEAEYDCRYPCTLVGHSGEHAIGPAPGCHVDFLDDDHDTEHLLGIAEDAGRDLEPDEFAVGLRERGCQRGKSLANDCEKQQTPAADKIG